MKLSVSKPLQYAINALIALLFLSSTAFGQGKNYYRSIKKICFLLLLLGTITQVKATITPLQGWTKVYTTPINSGGANLTNTVSYPIANGPNRLLVVAISAGGPNSPGVLPTVTWGGQSLTSLSVNRTDNNRAQSFIFYLKEPGIAAASGNSLVVNMGTPNYYGYVTFAAVYQDVDQTTTVRNGAAPSISGTSATPSVATASADFVAGDQGIFVTGYSVNGGTATASYSSVSSNWTGSSALFGGLTSASGAIGPYYGGVGVRSVTTAATAESVSMTATVTAALRPSITVFSLVPARYFYRSIATGNWSSTATWEQSSDGATYSAAVNTPTSFDHVIIQNGNTVTVGANAEVNNLIINSGGTLATSSTFTLSVSGTTNATGTLTLAGTGAKTFTGDITLNSGAVWNETGNSTYAIAGSLTNNATTFTANTGVHTFSGTSQTISGSATSSIPSVAVTGTYTNSGTLTVATALSGAGTLSNASTLNTGGTVSTTTLSNSGTMNVTGSGNLTTALANFTNTGTINLNGSGTIAGITNNASGIVNLASSGTITSFNNATATSTLNISALPVPTITTLTVSAAGNTVNYSGAGNQTAIAVAYKKLGLSGSGVKTLGGTVTVATNLSIDGTATASLNTGTTYTVGTLTLGGAGKSSGTWGSTASTATNQTNTYFAATTGRVSVTTDSRPSITITATGPTKVYGTALTTGTSTTDFSVTGTLASGESVTEITLTPNGVGLSASTAAGSGYTVTPSLATGTGGFSASNYNITYTAFSGTVTAKALTVTGATTADKVYNGNNTATVTGGTLVGIVGSDVVTLTQSGTFAQTGVGTSIAITSTSSISGANSANYTLTQPSLTARDITAKALTVTGATTANKTYDGNNTATVTGGTLVGKVGSDVVTLTQSGTFGQTEVGTGIAITSTSSIGGANSGNYTLTQPSLTARNITAKALTVTGLTGSSKEYDGLTTASATGTAALSGIVGSEIVTLDGTPTFTFVSANAGTPVSITTTGYTISGANSANYSLTQPTLSANITTLTPTVTVTVGIYTYNGLAQGPNASTNTGTGTSYTYSYVGVSGTSYAASATRPTNAGSYTVTATVAANGNYASASSSATAFTIGVATPTVTPTIGSYTYTGSAVGPTAATNTGTGTSYTFSYAGVSATVYAASSTRPTNAGSYTVTVTVAANGNYASASSSATAFTIGVATPVVTPTIGSYTYNGSAQGPTAATNTGTGSSYTYSYVGVAPTVYTASANRPTNAGSYRVTATVAADGNYGSASSSATNFTIAKVALTITAADQTVAYGASVSSVTSAGTYTPTGFVNNETSSVIGGSATYTTTYTTTTLPGASGLTITAGSLSATNYTFNYSAGTITVYPVSPMTYSASGTFVVPAGVSCVMVEAWGAGGGGSTTTDAGGGGGGGAYASSVLTLTAGNAYNFTIGTGGADGVAGGNTTFNTSDVKASGGAAGTSGRSGGAGGTVASSIGTVRYAGGNGGNGAGGGSGNHGGGGGGGSATPSANGSNGSSSTDDNGGNGGSGQGAGGAGGDTGSSGANGTSPGGGGGGNGYNGSNNAGNGANGQIKLTWLDASNFSASTNASACAQSASIITVASTSLSNGDYKVTYNLSGAHTATASTATMTFTAGTGTFNTSALSNSGSTTITITNITFVGWSCSASISSNNVMNVTVNAIPSVPTAGSSSRCGTGTVSISATPGAGETIDWYSLSSAGTLLLSGSTGYSPNINNTTTYYAQARNTTTGCISSTRTAVTATINSVPTVTSVTPSSICSGTASLSTVVSAGATADWYAAASGGTVLASGSTSFTTPSLLSTTTYYVEARNSTSGCLSAARTSVTATVQAPVTTGVTICQNGASDALAASISCADLTGQSAIDLPATASASGSGTTWSNATRVYANDNSYATMSVSGNSTTARIINASNFGFAIPSNATINGVTATIGRFASANGSSDNAQDNSVKIIKSGTATGTNLGATSTRWPTSEAAATYGSSSNLWGTTLTPADVNSSTFGLQLSVDLTAGSGNTTMASVDYMQLEITYTVPGSLNWYTASSGGTLVGTGASFNPVGVANSGLANTATAGTTKYYVECSSTAGCRAEASFVINPTLTAGVSIASNAASNTIYSGTSVIFTATPTNGGSSPSYQWKLNGSNVGTNSTTYTTSALVNNDAVTVVMTSNATPCLAGSPATSNSITITVNANLTASVSIASSATDNTICSGSSVTFTATPTNGGASPSYQWKLNGNNIGTNSATYTNSALSDTDSVRVVMTSNAAGVSSPTVTSSKITTTVRPVGQWLGLTSAWSTASNWCGGVPILTTDVTINSGTPFNPILHTTIPANVRNLTINSGASVDANSGTLNINGNWTNNGSYNGNTGNVVFKGADQSIGGSNSTSFYDITIQGAGSKTLSQPITVTHALTLTNGYIVADATNKVIINNNADASGASDGSFVKGPVQKIGTAGLTDATFIFPTGQTDNLYDPVKIKFLAASNDIAFTVTHYHSATSADILPSSIAITQSNLNADAKRLTVIKTNEYWDIHNDNVGTGDILGTYGVDITMHYHDDPTDSRSPTYMYILHNNGTQWEVPNKKNQKANRATWLGPNAFEIVLPAQKSFSAYTVGGSASALPVTLMNFTAKATPERTASLNWSTSSETVNKGFGIERQAGGVNGKYERIGYVASKALNGNSQTALYYNFIDMHPGTGETAFYRLAQEDMDGTISYSEVRVVKFNGQTVSMMYPNPTRGVVNISRTANGSKMNIQVSDMSGRLIQQINNVTDSNYKLSINYSGMYNIKLVYPETGEQTIQKIVVQK